MKRRPTAARGLYPSGLAAALLLACMMLLGGAGLCAQDTSKIPTLKVWYEVPGIEGVRLIDNFDTANGGRYAMAVLRLGSMPWPGALTWYNRSIGDTTNQFTWDGGEMISPVDFNGDGVRDYIVGGGRIYEGIRNGAPPKPLPVAEYKIPAWVLERRSTGDFNGDGKEDFMERVVEDPPIGSAPSGPIGKIILGNSDLTKMEVVDMPQLEGAYSIQNIVSAWRENGKSYVVLYQYTDSGYNPRSDKFVLYEFVITDTGVVYTQRDRITTMQWPTSSRPYYSFSSSFVWHSRDGKEHTLVVTLGPNTRTSDVYAIINGRFVHAYHKEAREYEIWPLAYSVKTMNDNGYARYYSRLCFVYHGNPALDSTRIARFPSVIGADEYVISSVSSIGDVNNDGKGDVAVVYVGNNTGILRMYLGADSISAVEETALMAPTMTLRNAQVGIDGSLGIELHIVRAARYTLELYDLRGNRVQALLDESFPSGNHDRVLQLSGANLPSGLYNLRLSDGVRAVDKGILIPR